MLSNKLKSKGNEQKWLTSEVELAESTPSTEAQKMILHRCSNNKITELKIKKKNKRNRNQKNENRLSRGVYFLYKLVDDRKWANEEEEKLLELKKRSLLLVVDDDENKAVLLAMVAIELTKNFRERWWNFYSPDNLSSLPLSLSLSCTLVQKSCYLQYFKK